MENDYESIPESDKIKCEYRILKSEAPIISETTGEVIETTTEYFLAEAFFDPNDDSLLGHLPVIQGCETLEELKEEMDEMWEALNRGVVNVS